MSHENQEAMLRRQVELLVGHCEAASLPAIRAQANGILAKHLSPTLLVELTRTQVSSVEDVSHNLAVAYLETVRRGRVVCLRPVRDEKPASPAQVFADLQAAIAAGDLDAYRIHLAELAALGDVGDMPPAC